MTFVVTEATLQIMGYRFYDVGGAPQEMSILLGGNRRKKKPDSNFTSGPHLSEILGIDLSQHEATSSGADSTSAGGTTIDDDVVYVDEYPAPFGTNFGAGFPSKLARAVRIQAKREKTSADQSEQYKAVIDGLMHEHEYVMNDVKPDDEDYGFVLEVFLDQEKQHLQKVLQSTVHFREKLENAITKRNPDSLVLYDVIFD